MLQIHHLVVSSIPNYSRVALGALGTPIRDTRALEFLEAMPSHILVFVLIHTPQESSECQSFQFLMTPDPTITRCMSLSEKIANAASKVELESAYISTCQQSKKI
jgi:hypothetical protein